MQQFSLFEELLREERETHWPMLEGPVGPRAVYNGQEVINFSSFNYLGLVNHPRVIEAARGALNEYGSDLSAPRAGGGNIYLHQMLEERLAEFKKLDSVLLFPSDISGAFAVFSFFLGPADLLMMDEMSNKRIYRFAGTNLRVFPHRDLGKARLILEQTGESRKRVFLGESVFELEGDIFPLNELAAEIKAHKIVLIVDDTVGVGMLGRQGRGVVDHFNLYGQVDIDLGSLSRAFGAQVGYVGGVKALTTYLVEHSPFFSMPTAPSPVAVASALAALDVVREEPAPVEQLWQNGKYFRTSLRQMGFKTGLCQTPLVPLIVDEDATARVFSDRLLERGVYAPCFTSPFVPAGRARLRFIVTAVHTKEDIGRTLDAVESAGRELRIIA